MLNEAQLIQSCQEGEKESFAFLYDQYVQKMYGFIFHKVLHKETAEDITSDVFLKALEKINTFDSSKASFATWLFTIARNRVTDHFRRSKEAGNREDIWDIASSEDIEERANSKYIYGQLQQHMCSLPVLQREMLMMRFWQDMTYAEIAEILGKSPGSVKVAVGRSIKKLKEHFLLFLFFSLFS